MTQVEPSLHAAAETNKQDPHQQPLSATPIDRILERLSALDLPAKEHVERYMRHKWRLNHKRSTLSGSFNSVRLFLDFYGKSGKREIEKVERTDLEAFIEQEQDRGLRISTVRTRLVFLIAFLHFLMEQDIIAVSVLKRGIRLKLPETLPRAIHPADIRKLISVIDNVRDRALTRPYSNLGVAYFFEGAYDKSIEAAQKAIQLDPKWSHAYYNLGLTYQKMRDSNKAIAMEKKALELDPTLEMAYYALGGIYFEKGQYEEAEKAFQKFLQIYPYFPEVHNLLAIIYAAQKKFDKGVRELEWEEKINPYHTLAHLNLGQIYWYEFQNRQKAITHLKIALMLDPFLPTRQRFVSLSANWKDSRNGCFRLFTQLSDHGDGHYAPSRY